MKKYTFTEDGLKNAVRVAMMDAFEAMKECSNATSEDPPAFGPDYLGEIESHHREQAGNRTFGKLNYGDIDLANKLLNIKWAIAAYLDWLMDRERQREIWVNPDVLLDEIRRAICGEEEK